MFATGLPLVGALDGAGAQEEPFGVGSARSTAQLLRVGPARGSLALAPIVGLSLSDYLGTRGRGEVRTVDVGVLSEFLPPELFEAFPTVKVESTDEGSERGTTASLGAPGGPGAAELHAEAGAEPYGASRFRAAPIDLAAVVIDGAQTETFSGVRDGRLREATSVVRIGKLDIGDGAMVLEGLEWRAVHRSGAEDAEQAQFLVGAVTVAGQRFAAPDDAAQPLADAVAAAQPLLGALGIQVSLPEARIEGGVAEMSPLRIRVTDSELSRVVAPVLGAVQPVREALIDAIRSGTEEADVALLVADIALGLVAGGSRLDVEIGGAIAMTAEPSAGFQFGSASGGFDLVAPSGGAAPSSGGAPAPASSARPATGNSTANSSAGTPDRTAPPTGSDAAGPRAVTPASSSGSDQPGPLLAIGLAALAAAALAGVADYHRVRRQPLPVPSTAAT